MDKRTWLAIVSSLMVYYVWMIWVSGNPVPEVEQTLPQGTIVSEQVNTTQELTAEPTKDSTTGLAANALKTPSVQEEPPAPVRNVPFEACELAGTVSTDGARLTNLTSTKYTKAYDISALWKWGYERISGASSDPWVPYGKSNEQAPILSANASGLVAGTGDYSSALQAHLTSESSDNLTIITIFSTLSVVTCDLDTLFTKLIICNF